MAAFARKRLQVFISSTFTDLIPERQAAVEAVLSAGHIPAGMELFAAGDESQMEVIKQWIDQSDVYMLILGGRYGSIEPKSGKSYTQIEYDYAVTKGKPLFACVITDDALEEKARTLGTRVKEDMEPKLLKNFRAEVLTRMSKHWSDERDIRLAVSQSLQQIERNNLVGWVRGNAPTPPNGTPPEGVINKQKSVIHAIDEADDSWVVYCHGDGQSEKIDELLKELSGSFSEDGRGKKFSSGYSYWGSKSTFAWENACTDSAHPMLKDSIKHFTVRFKKIIKQHLDGHFHYVSLGIGTGAKDRIIIDQLGNDKHIPCFFPVDMSIEMLRLGAIECRSAAYFRNSSTLFILIDFSDEKNIDKIKKVVHSAVGEDPVLYSCLGNTVANFDDDTSVLENLAKLLRKQDRLFIEIAETLECNETVATKIIDEYKSPKMRAFALSALDSHSSLEIENNEDSKIKNNEDSLDFKHEIENIHETSEPKSVLIRAVYKNKSKETKKIKILPSCGFIDLPPNDTIRLLLTRKYSCGGVKYMIKKAGLHTIEFYPTRENEKCKKDERYSNEFGWLFILLNKTE